ncbi:MAG: hypothetical protein Q7T10_16255 [Rhodoferax sp.]|uniref:hypothetical protein n=1 Tax=Rhodoferax sp. TaxID=50421 RepID=UPI00271EA8CC|nr:hypothetical protein [Rhodoferax sp.]MDO8450352.1 hypothetical protein [Rhodoferax sp.]
MSKSLDISTDYDSCRYFIPTSLLASQTSKSTAKVRKRIMKPEPLTYAKLIAGQQQLVVRGELNPRTCANRATALRHFLRANHLQEEDVIGLEMRPHYPLSVERTVEKLRSENRGDRDITNTKAAISPWKRAVVQHDNEVAHISSTPTPFLHLLKETTKGQNIKKVSREAGVPLAMLHGWLRGKSPRQSNAKLLRRLEVFFGIERDSLVGLAGFSIDAKEKSQVAPAVPVDFRERQRDREKSRYYLQVPPSSPLRAQWLEFMRYKTVPVPILERSGRGKWTFAAMLAKIETPSSWYTFLDGVEIPTAYAAASKILAYLGWMSLSRCDGGLGLPADSMHTLGWLAVPDYIEQYLDWMKARAGGKRTTGTAQFLAIISSMVRPRVGYLSQLPAFQSTLPGKYQGTDWSKLCQQQFDYVNKLQAAFQSEIVSSRDSFEPIRHILDLQQPMEAVADMVQRMRADRPTACASAEAVWARDIFTVKLFVSNPLRLRNIACLEWAKENVDGRHPDRCSLYQKVDGAWWIYVPKRFMKNRGGKQIRDYDSPVHQSVWGDLERYLLRHRPSLIRWPTDLVFLTRDRDPARTESVKSQQPYSKPAPTGHRPFLEISGRLFELTRRYLWKCDGIHSHAFRHIVATSILKTAGGDIKTAALVLHDAEATVAKHYSGMRSSDGAVRMAELLGKTFERM